jgi:hypothetical protein
MVAPSCAVCLHFIAVFTIGSVAAPVGCAPSYVSRVARRADVSIGIAGITTANPANLCLGQCRFRRFGVGRGAPGPHDPRAKQSSRWRQTPSGERVTRGNSPSTPARRLPADGIGGEADALPRGASDFAGRSRSEGLSGSSGRAPSLRARPGACPGPLHAKSNSISSM